MQKALEIMKEICDDLQKKSCKSCTIDSVCKLLYVNFYVSDFGLLLSVPDKSSYKDREYRKWAFYEPTPHKPDLLHYFKSSQMCKDFITLLDRMSQNIGAFNFRQCYVLLHEITNYEDYSYRTLGAFVHVVEHIQKKQPLPYNQPILLEHILIDSFLENFNRCSWAFGGTNKPVYKYFCRAAHAYRLLLTLEQRSDDNNKILSVVVPMLFRMYFALTVDETIFSEQVAKLPVDRNDFTQFINKHDRNTPIDRLISTFFLYSELSAISSIIEKHTNTGVIINQRGSKSLP